ncbi:nuclear transport factor 2 family protein [Halalkalicoccus sp. NIPERK01]|uniref:nuclear transport factor 2 family protein n=1 Tax=Halalkalicoccus sp. NIPERK01 TaxID=3053469 RepID=UPI00256EF352|nr:nuclear transport factor 2 family protein [Halalkalicoccus sp. NIPERK01]MDL5361627.1 nuclear transport factor 2 family protein [Halalkalicoccus sp. NIPERK01]
MSADEQAIHDYYEYVDDEAYDDLFSLFSEDVVYHRPGQEPIEGIEEFETFYREVRAIERGTHTVADLVVDGSTVAVRGYFSGVLEGQQVEFGFADVHEFDEEGLIEERFTYTDTGRV